MSDLQKSVALNVIRRIHNELVIEDSVENKLKVILKIVSDETKAVLDTLDEEVTIYVIGSKETVDDGVRLYLDAYKKWQNVTVTP